MSSVVLSNCLNRITTNLREIKNDLRTVLSSHPDYLSLGQIDNSILREVLSGLGWDINPPMKIDVYTQTYSRRVKDECGTEYIIEGDFNNGWLKISKCK